MSKQPSVSHTVGYLDGPEVGARISVPTAPAILEPLAVDARAMGPNHYLAGGREPDAGFVAKLRLADDRMVVFWNSLLHGGRWVIWRKQWSGEYTLVTPVWSPDTQEYWPLDNRVLAILYASDPEKHGGVRAMWRQVRGQLEADKAALKQRNMDRIDAAWEAASTHAKIRTGYGECRGNKSSTHAHWDKEKGGVTEKDNPLR